jgi:uncharacterized protein
VLSAESLLVTILKRAKELSAAGADLFATPAFSLFLKNDFSHSDFENNKELLAHFSKLDDSDVSASVKVWCDHSDPILSKLCDNLLNRKLFSVEMADQPIAAERKKKMLQRVAEAYQMSEQDAGFFVFTDTVNNSAYNATHFKINILMGDGSLVDVTEASDQLNLQSLSKTVTKHFICYPKEFKGTL